MSDKRPRAKHKVDRRFGCNLWGRPKSPYNVRQSRPGMHGQARGKQTDFGIQLQAKQKLKAYYGNIGEKMFRRYYKEAVRLRGDTGQNLIGILERRLDAIIYRAKFAPTVFAARQLVSHKHVTVNGQKVNIPSYMIKEGDVIEIRESARQIPAVMQGMEDPTRDIPEYLEVDAGKFTLKQIRTPRLEDVPYPVQMDPNLIVEFYSR